MKLQQVAFRVKKPVNAGLVPVICSREKAHGQAVAGIISCDLNGQLREV
uniref:Uncharacterized protein n=1 Tax=Peronospora matthiolae TaxID=2874970 RepID=A0AAV1TEG4_9STRA